MMCISGIGEPVIIATDTPRIPKKVAHIASTFGARLWKPENEISVREKIRLTRKMKTANSHERDALAAALCARNHYSNLFRKIDKKLRLADMEGISGIVKEAVVKRKVSIARAVKMSG